MSSLTECDTVGRYMHATLADNTKVKGTIFTYNSSVGLIVLFKNNTSPFEMKMINTSYIKDFKLSEGAHNRLPHRLDPSEELPSMHIGRTNSIFKEANTELKKAEGQWLETLKKMDSEKPIGACEALVKVGRVFRDINWDDKDEVINVTRYVYILGNPDWTNPKAVLVKDAPAREKQMVTRIQLILDSIKKEEHEIKYAPIDE